MIDETETIRRNLVATINAEPGSREYLEAQHGQVWDTNQLQEQFDVLGFMSPMIAVIRKSDGIKGSFFSSTDPASTSTSNLISRWWLVGGAVALLRPPLFSTTPT